MSLAIAWPVRIDSDLVFRLGTAKPGEAADAPERNRSSSRTFMWKTDTKSDEWKGDPHDCRELR